MCCIVPVQCLNSATGRVQCKRMEIVSEAVFMKNTTISAKPQVKFVKETHQKNLVVQNILRSLDVALLAKHSSARRKFFARKPDSHGLESGSTQHYW